MPDTTRFRLQYVKQPSTASPVGAARPQNVTKRLRTAIIDALAALCQHVDRVMFYRAPFRFLHPDERLRTDADSTDAPAGWIGPVRLGHGEHHGLLCEPGCPVVFRGYAPLGATFIAWCSVLSDNLPANGAMEFTVAASAGSHSCARRTTLRITPRPRWHRLRLKLPPEPDGPLVVTLSTRWAGASHGAVRAVWGDPCLEHRWPVSGLLRDAWAALCVMGVQGTLRRLTVAAWDDRQTEEYRRWLEANAPGEEGLRRMGQHVLEFAYRPTISILTPVRDTDPTWLRGCIESVRQQIYPEWELCLSDDGSTMETTRAVLREYAADPRIRIAWSPSSHGISAASNAALHMATGEFIGLLDHDDVLAPEALFEFVRRLNQDGTADILYSDEDKIDLSGIRREPYFKPDWSPEHLLSNMYTCHFLVVRRDLAVAVGGFRSDYDGSQDYDLLLRLIERTSRVVHVPKVLYGWRMTPQSAASSRMAKGWAVHAGRRALEDYVRRNAIDAQVLPVEPAGHYRVRRRIAESSLVSIIVVHDEHAPRAAPNEGDMLVACVRALARNTRYQSSEVILVHGERLTERAARFLERAHCRLVHSVAAALPVNVARSANLAAAQARGSHLLILHADVRPMEEDWLTAMLEYSEQEAIGAVGAKLTTPDGKLDHVGILVGVCGVAAHAWQGLPASTRGYMSSAIGVRNYSAVSAACLMTRRDVFWKLDGFDERFGRDLFDVDYCLRARQAGYRVVSTPYAQMRHEHVSEPRGRFPEELKEFRRRWGEQPVDPYYHPGFDRDSSIYRLRPPTAPR